MLVSRSEPKVFLSASSKCRQALTRYFEFYNQHLMYQVLGYQYQQRSILEMEEISIRTSTGRSLKQKGKA